MEFTVVEKNAEDMLYALLVEEETKASIRNEKMPDMRFLHCQFFHIAITASLDDMRNSLGDIQDVEECVLYFCSDGDIIIKWNGGGNDTRDQLVKSICEKFNNHINQYMEPKEFFIDYNLLNDRAQLKTVCAKKMKKQTKQSKELAKYFSDAGLIETLRKTVNLTKMQRTLRTKLNILIVEDQKFSQKILSSILKEYTCHVAEGSGEALLLYLEKCPDIVFLDIDLPDLSGHKFAKLADDIDKDSYVVMVSANQYASDIKTAKENNVKGFISKPYEKEAILKAVDLYKKARKGRTT